MNRFKTNLNDNKVEDYSRRKEQVQLLGILDKCTQVLRDDRIWLRNRIKEADVDVVQIFKKYLSKRPADLSCLQVNLRKYVMRIKDKCKKDQLQKFKENLNNAASTTLFDRQNERSSKSVEMKKPPSFRAKYQDQEDYQPTNPINNLKNYNRLRGQYLHGQTREYEERRSNMGRNREMEGVRMTETHHQEEIEQTFSYRSKSEFNRPQPSQRTQEKKQEQEERPFSHSWLKPNNFVGKREIELQLDIEDEEEGFIQLDHPMLSKKQPHQAPLLRQTNASFTHQIYQIEQSQVELNPLKSQMHSHTNSNLANSQTYFLHDNSDTFSHQFKIELNCNSNSLQPPSFSGTPAATSEDKISFTKYNLNVIRTTNTQPPNTHQHLGRDETHLFTNPSLLEECKRYLQESRSASDSASNQEGFHTQRSNPPLQKSSERSNKGSDYLGLAYKARDCNSETKVDPTISNPIYQQKYSQNPLPYLGVVESFERDDNEQFADLIPDISKLYAEDVFDIIFCSVPPSLTIPFKAYERIVTQNFVEKDKLIKLFKLGDKNMTNTLSALDFGRLLLTNCNYKPSPNPVKQIFSLIDIDRKGYFTLDDYQRFLEQVIDSEDSDSDRIIDICESLFQKADMTRSERVEYWGLYLTKGSQEFRDFSTFLEQFQFQFEVV